MLSIAYEDAFIAYINGVEVARANIGEPGETTDYDQYADSTFHFEADMLGYGPFSPGYVIEEDKLNACLIEGTMFWHWKFTTMNTILKFITL